VINWLKRLLQPTTVIQVNSIQDLFPLFDPELCTIGVKKGALDSHNAQRLIDGMPFEFNGSPNDFIVLPKVKPPEIKE